jgi:S1-C subfamily serine protease
MQLDHVSVSSEEVTQIEDGAYPPYSLWGGRPSGIPRWAMVTLSPAVAILPLLCLLIVVSRVAIRDQQLYVKYAWVCFFSTLLIISGTVSSVAAVIFLSLPRMPVVVSRNIPDFDERKSYPHLPSMSSLGSAEVSIELKPLVIIVSPASRLSSGRTSTPLEFGAGVLLLANKEGYLFATAKHVIASGGNVPRQVMVSAALGMRASADVAAIAENVDLALLWINRRSGNAAFTQPIGQVSDGEPVFVIGHPEGLNYTLSTGIVSGLRGTKLQISAAISPGNSGGPVYDVHGNLVGIVISKFDQNRDANAENLGFATIGEVLREDSGWRFAGEGERRLRQYIQALKGR